MSYKEFEDFYREATIKHLALFEHDGFLISPPFCTETCKDYSKVMVYKNKEIKFIDVDTPPATSKYNSMAAIEDSLFFIPYGIWDNFNTVLELRNFEPAYHEISSSASGQFYNLASDGKTAFSAPLGYDNVNFCIFIKNGKVTQVPVNTSDLKCHMGTVFLNGMYYSPPRGECVHYNKILKFNPELEEITQLEVPGLPKAKRKYSDFIAVKNKLYALPFGHLESLSDILVLDTDTDQIELINLDIPAFLKKYNTGVLVGEKIIALPYGHKEELSSNLGLVFDTETHDYFTFDIGSTFGGKYRFRSGVEFNGCALYLPTGSPNAEIMSVNTEGKIVFRTIMKDYVLGRPVIYYDKVCTMAYNINSKDHYLFSLDKNFTISLDFLF